MATSLTLLMIDPSPHNRENYRRLLNPPPRPDTPTLPSYIVLESNSGAAGLLFCQQWQVDVIVLNATLPDFSGLDFLAKLATWQEGIHVPIVLLLDQPDPALARSAIAAGAQDCLTQDELTPERLHQALEFAIARMARQTQCEHMWQTANVALESKIQEQATILHQNRIRSYAILSAIPDLLLRVSRDGTCLDCILPKDATPHRWLIPSETIAEILPPDLLAQELEGIALAIDTGDVQVYTHQLAKFGNIHYEEVRIAPCGDDEVLIIVRDVTERQHIEEQRKQAELALQTSEERFRAIFDQAAIGIAYTALDGSFLKANRRFCEITGYSPMEILGLRFHDITHPDDLANDLIYSERLLNGEIDTFSMEKRYRCKDGSIIWTHISVSVFSFAPYGPQCFLGIVQDISDRKQGEADRQAATQALQQSELKLNQITNAIPGAVYQFHRSANGEYSFPFITPGVVDLYEYTPAQVQQNISLMWDAVLPEHMPSLIASIQESARTLAPWEFEYRILTPSQQLKWISGKSVPTLQPDGSILWNGIITDISERKHLENALQDLNQKLEQRVQQRTQELLASQEALYRREQEFRTLVENSPDSIIRIDHTLCYLYVNPAVGQDLGIHPCLIIGKTAVELGFPSSLIEFWQDSLQTVSTTKKELMIEYEIPLAKGAKIYQAQIVPELSPEGDVESFLCVARDISELKQIQAALQEREQVLRKANSELELRVENRTMELKAAKEAAEAANRAKSSFLANMSHELRTPLNAILGFSQLLSRDYSLNPKHYEQLGIINRSGEHLLNLINDILEMSKIEAGRATLNCTIFDVYEFLNAVRDMFQLRAENKGLNFSCQWQPQVPQYIRADEGKLRQVLINLLGNAIKFTATGYVTLRVSASSAAPELLHFQVEDTGIGIAPEDLDRLFEPFVQVQNRHSYHEGTGLGLPISQQFVQLMGGRLTVKSTLQRGSIFEFELPVEKMHNAELMQRELRQRAIALAPDQPTFRILIVEDQWENRNLLLSLLEPMGFEVQQASHGEDAIARWQQWQPHLIWMDIRMPVMDGYEATRQIRAQEAQATPPTRTKIIALTAGAFHEDRDRVLAAGCDDFVSKPLQETVIVDKIAEHLGAHYLYEDDQAGPQPASTLTPQTLRVMPQDWLINLHIACRQLDTKRVMDLIQAIPPDQANLAQALTERIEDFDFEQVMNLSQAATELV
jgi:PAS domain S-box-containing protein